MVRFDDLILERVIFEVRFPRGYLYWDNCGKIWLALSAEWPNLVAHEVSPERAHLQLGDETIHLSFAHNRMGTHQDYPAKLVFCQTCFCACLFLPSPLRGEGQGEGEKREQLTIFTLTRH